MTRVRIRNKRTRRFKQLREREARIFVQTGRWEYVTAEAAPTPAPSRPARSRPPAPDPVEAESAEADEAGEAEAELEEAGPVDELEDMAYNDLRALAAERGIKPEGRKREDYLRALRYETRRMDAED